MTQGSSFSGPERRVPQVMHKLPDVIPQNASTDCADQVVTTEVTTAPRKANSGGRSAQLFLGTVGAARRHVSIAGRIRAKGRMPLRKSRRKDRGFCEPKLISCARKAPVVSRIYGRVFELRTLVPFRRCSSSIYRNSLDSANCRWRRLIVKRTKRACTPRVNGPQSFGQIPSATRNTAHRRSSVGWP